MVSSSCIRKVTLIFIAFIFFILASKGWGGIVIIDVDDKSIEELGMWPWTRDIHGRLIDVLNEYGTKAIIFDMIFSEPDSRYPEKDQVLIDAVKKNQNIYFASVFYPLIEGNPQIIERMNLLDRFKISYQKTISEDIRYIRGALLPIEGLSLHAKGVGFVNVFSEEEVKPVHGKGVISIPQRGMVTQFPLLMIYSGTAYPSLPLLVALDYLNIELNSIRIKPDSYLQINDLYIPIDSKGDFKLRFSPPYTRFSHHSYIDVLKKRDDTLPHILKGALVIVSHNATGFSDYKVTPVSNYFPGSELIATAIENIISLVRTHSQKAPDTGDSINKLKRGNASEKLRAIRLLSTQEDEKVIEPMLDALDDEDGMVRIFAAKGLGNFKDERILNPLIKALEDEDEWVRMFAANSLGTMNDETILKPLLKAFKRDKAGMIDYAALVIRYPRNKEAIEALCDIKDSKDIESETEKRLAEDALAFSNTLKGEKNLNEFLINSLNNREAKVRKLSVLACSLIRDKRVIEPLISLLRDKNEEIRKFSANSLVYFGDKRATIPLVYSLRDKDKDVRKASAFALGFLGDERALKPLIETVQREEDEDVKAFAALALGFLGNKEALNPLIKALNDPGLWVRAFAAESLGRLKNREAIKKLALILNKKKEEKEVKKRAEWAIGQIQKYGN